MYRGADPYTNTNPDSYTNTNPNSNSYTNSNPYTNLGTPRNSYLDYTKYDVKRLYIWHGHDRGHW